MNYRLLLLLALLLAPEASAAPRIWKDRVSDTTTTTGTGALTVSGSAPSKYVTFSSVLTVADTFCYLISHRTAAEWETGIGTYSALNQITRTTVHQSSNSNLVVSLSAGTKDIYLTFNSGCTIFPGVTVGTSTTAGTATCAIDSTMAGAAATDNFVNCTGTMPSAPTTSQRGAMFTFAKPNFEIIDTVSIWSTLYADMTGGKTASNDNNGNSAIYGRYSASSRITAPNEIRIDSAVRGEVVPNANFVSGSVSAGVHGLTNGSPGGTTHWTFGVLGGTYNSGSRAGVYGFGEVNGADFTAGGAFVLTGNGQANPIVVPLTGAVAALIAGNGAQAADIFRLYDNTTLQYSMVDGGTGTFVSKQTFGTGLIATADAANVEMGNVLTIGGITARTAITPDSWFIATGTTSNAVHLAETLDVGFDFNNGRCLTTACTTPSLIIHSPDQVTTEYLHLRTDATGAAHVQSNLAEITVGGFKNNITEAAAQVIVKITMPSAGMFGATVTYLVFDSNGTDHVARSGNIVIQGANKAGTSACTINAARDTEAEDGSQVANAAGALTLTYTWTHVVNGASCDLSLNAASSAGANTYDITYTVLLMGNSNAITVNPQ